ncbi:MAG: hypothetical protein H7644_12330, partial [Candidatus Heimdallarchaeota archaeon]|nr:hypothetical protein [Candidatus Heimdallarchaeota archaeon]MCK5144548.1 hypothetical protein [Candidatus Heimdallarchaeota archaeon]
MKFRIIFRGVLTLAFLWGLVYAVAIGTMLIVFYVGEITVVSQTFSIVLLPIIVAIAIIFIQF